MNMRIFVSAFAWGVVLIASTSAGAGTAVESDARLRAAYIEAVDILVNDENDNFSALPEESRKAVEQLRLASTATESSDRTLDQKLADDKAIFSLLESAGLLSQENLDDLSARQKAAVAVILSYAYKPQRLDFRSASDVTAGFQRLIGAEKTVARASEASDLGTYRSSNVGGDDLADPSFLLNSEQTQVTPVLLAVSQSVGEDVRDILRWASQIDVAATWGSTQDASHTASSMKGTTADVASATAALLRLAGVPTRFVVGRVRVSAEDYMQWFGAPFENIDAATDYHANAGGEVVLVTSGGQISAVIFNHIWLEVAVDYHPSRGVRNNEPDLWVPTDPSFRKVGGPQDVDYPDLVNFDIEGIREGYADGLTLDPNGQWFSGGDLAGFLTALSVDSDQISAAQSALDGQFSVLREGRDSISLTQIVSNTVGDSSGVGSSGLRASLPYRVEAINTRSSTIPGSLNFKVRFGFGRGLLGDITSVVERDLYTLNAKNVSIASVFATEGDLQQFSAAFPSDSATLPSQLSQTSLVRVIPEVRIVTGTDYEVVLRGGSKRIGELDTFGYSIRRPGAPYLPNKFNIFPSGSLLAFGVAATSIPPSYIAELRDELTQHKDALESSSSAQELAAYAPNFTNLVYGSSFSALLADYFGRPQVLGDLIVRGADAGASDLIAGAGIAGHIPTVNYFFDQPNRASKGTLQVDVGLLLYNIVSSDGSPERSRDLAEKIGAYSSALEGELPTRLLSPDPSGNSGIGYAASSNLASALEEGQRVYRLRPSEAIPQELQLSVEARQDIENALMTGREVTVHSGPLSVDGPIAGLNTIGYVVSDPDTGAGQYLLDAGTNGGLSAENANDFMAMCAYINRPEFIDTNNDWERQEIIDQCAAVARIPELNLLEEIELIFNRLELVEKFFTIYAQVPMIQADCIVANIPELAQALIFIQTAAIQFAVIVADPRFVLGLGELDQLADSMQFVVDQIQSVCQ